MFEKQNVFSIFVENTCKVMEKIELKTTHGVNAMVIAEKCGCSKSAVYKIWNGEVGKYRTELYLRVIKLTNTVAESYNLPQL